MAEIFDPGEVSVDFLNGDDVKGIILSGGPQSVFDSGSPRCDLGIFDLGKPVLGICYGHQFVHHNLGGLVKSGDDHEFGRAELLFDSECPLFHEIFGKNTVVWMSHGDEVTELADGFVGCGQTEGCLNSATWNAAKKIFTIQFHPEVTHSADGNQILKNFLDVCEVAYDWSVEKFLEEETKILKKKVGDKSVVLFVSGGVDSTVAFAFLSRVFGEDRVRGLFVNTGLLREGEVAFVQESVEGIGAHLTVIDAGDEFLGNLDGVFDPEKKRGIIGNSFLDVQHKFFSENDLHDDFLLAQGTIYPDTIETGGTKNSATIKTHHNRVPEIQKLIDEGKVVEPLAELYKDEVRELGELLGLPHHLVWRHPFPGPGLGVRILCSEKSVSESAKVLSDGGVMLPLKSVGVQGDFRTYRHPVVLNFKRDGGESLEDLEMRATEVINKNSDVNRALVLLGTNFEGDIDQVSLCSSFVTRARVKLLQKVDYVVSCALDDMELYSDVWQFPVVLAPVSFNDVGGESVILRPVDSIDAMSASVGKLSWEFFDRVSSEILKDVGISAVFLDVTSKPPGTIEWE